MSGIELIIIAVGLSMDAFAASVCKGLALSEITFASAVKVGLYFGFFQGAMPLFGYLLGVQLEEKIMAVDHWIALILLGGIGLNMVLESRNPKEKKDGGLEVGSMLLLAVATSIDALAVGVTFAFLQVNIFHAALEIGAITFVLSAIGVRLGHTFGRKWKGRAELFGGLVLICMGIKILLSHTL